MTTELPARLQTKYATDLMAFRRGVQGPLPLGTGGWQGVSEILFAALEDIGVHLNRMSPDDEQFRVAAVAIAKRRLRYFNSPKERYIVPKPTLELVQRMLEER